MLANSTFCFRYRRSAEIPSQSRYRLDRPDAWLGILFPGYSRLSCFLLLSASLLEKAKWDFVCFRLDVDILKEYKRGIWVSTSVFTKNVKAYHFPQSSSGEPRPYLANQRPSYLRSLLLLNTTMGKWHFDSLPQSSKIHLSSEKEEMCATLWFFAAKWYRRRYSSFKRSYCFQGNYATFHHPKGKKIPYVFMFLFEHRSYCTCDTYTH